MNEITVEVWGDFACFSAPETKVERMTYPFPTPSAARGILSAIYSKPAEFYWQVNRIEVLNKIRYISFKRNETTKTIPEKKDYGPEDVICLDDYIIKKEKNGNEKIRYINRTQRQTVALQDVRYRLVASIVPRNDFFGSETQLVDQALRRIRGGKCYMQPCFGLREFTAYFEESDNRRAPIEDSLDAGLMVYDVFDLHDATVRKKTQPKLSLFHAVMQQGVIQIPPYDSPQVIKGGTIC